MTFGMECKRVIFKTSGISAQGHKNVFILLCGFPKLLLLFCFAISNLYSFGILWFVALL